MKILFHICCSNCALFPVKLVRSEGHEFAGYWYNPNIHPFEEYTLRIDSLRKLADDWHLAVLYTDEYRPEEFFDLFNVEAVPLPPERCRHCYLLRLEKTAAKAYEEGFEAFSTTLLISPYQDFDQIIKTGRQLAGRYNVRFYDRDFRPYFKDALALSREMSLYRQKYCGCIFSKEERDQAIKAKELSRGR